MEKKKIYLSLTAAVILSIAVLWLLFRACSSGPSVSKKIFEIGRDSNWYPMDLRGKEKALVGFSNDLIQQIGKKEGFTPIVFEVGGNALFDGLDIENYDAVFSSVTPDVINRKKYLFSEPFYLVGPVLVVREDSSIKSMRELKGKILGIEAGALQVFNIPEPSDILIIPYPTSAKALEDLDGHVIDGVLLDALKAYVWTDGFYAGRLKVATSPLTDKGLRLVTLNKPEYVPWINQFNQGLKFFRQNGRYNELVSKWDLIDTEIIYETTPPPAVPAHPAPTPNPPLGALYPLSAL